MPQLAVAPADDVPASIGRRATARLRLSIPARMVSIFATCDCILIDLSRSGAQIALAEPLALGESGYLVLGRHEAFVEVVRRTVSAEGGVNGLAFDAPLSDQDVLAVRHYAESIEQFHRRALRKQVRKWVTGEN
jgi:hypothetical protein